MQTEWRPGGILTDREHLVGRNRQGRPAAVVGVVGIGHEKAQRIIAALEVQDDKIPLSRSLRAGDGS